MFNLKRKWKRDRRQRISGIEAKIFRIRSEPEGLNTELFINKDINADVIKKIKQKSGAPIKCFTATTLMRARGGNGLAKSTMKRHRASNGNSLECHRAVGAERDRHLRAIFGDFQIKHLDVPGSGAPDEESELHRRSRRFEENSMKKNERGLKIQTYRRLAAPPRHREAANFGERN
jgi:hypothetical protein